MSTDDANRMNIRLKQYLKYPESNLDTDSDWNHWIPHFRPIPNPNEIIAIRLMRSLGDPNEYIAYTTATLGPDGSLDMTDLGIGNPGIKLCAVVRFSSLASPLLTQRIIDAA